MRRLGTIARVAVVRHRVEVRRRRDHPQLGAAVLLGAGFATLLVVGSLPGLEAIWPEPGAYRYGSNVAEEPTAVLARAREVGAIAAVLFAGLAALGATTSDDWERPPVDLLTAVPTPTAALGVLCEEVLEHAWVGAPVAAGGSLAFAAGSGRAVTLVAAAPGAFLAVCTAFVAGTAAGLTLRTLVRGSRFYRLRFGVGFVCLFLGFVGLTASRTAGRTLAATPLGWYGDLLVLTAPGATASLARATAALAGSVVVLVGSLAIVLACARLLWFDDRVGGTEAEGAHAPESDAGPTATGSAGAETDGVVPGSDGGSTGTEGPPLGPERARTSPIPTALEAALERACSRPTAAVAVATWLRMRRSPRALLFVVFPLALVGPVTADVTARSPALVPPLVACYVAAAPGLGTTLNPLGNERSALPSILSTPGGRRSMLRGHAVAALVPGVPAALAAGTAAGVALEYGPLELLALGIVAVALSVGGVGISLGVGTFLPNLDGPAPASATLSPPELPAMAAYLLVMTLLVAPAIGGFAGEVGLASGTSLTVGLAAASGLAGHRYAVQSLERYESTER